MTGETPIPGMIGETVDGECLAHVGHEEGAVAQHPAQLHRPQIRRHHHRSQPPITVGTDDQ